MYDIGITKDTRQREMNEQEILSKGKTLCSVCIASYQRPEMLKTLLKSLMQQNLPPTVVLEIIVVDNDSNETARPVIEEFVSDRFPIYYYVEERKNISHARNTSVANAKGDYILFIDDDEVASMNWVRNHLETLKKYDADIVFGPILSQFHDQAPEWSKKIYLFNRPILATGAQPHSLTTGNCLIKASLLKAHHQPFDPIHGETGGEDIYFFTALQNSGANLVYCAEGNVSEDVPLSRTSASWVIKRAFRTGNIYARRQIDIAHKKTITRTKFFLDASAKLLASIGLMVLYLFNRDKRWHWFLKIFANLGKLAGVVGIHITGY